MSRVFSSAYSQAYDLVYSDKDYEAECNFVEEAFKVFGEGATHSILDLGCGTGGHSIPMARRGYEVWGVDRSESMLAHAREKAAEIGAAASPVFQLGDMQSLRLGRDFDAVMIMFAALGYQIENSEVLAVLDTAYRHLRKGGLLLTDIWYGPAVLRQRPSDKVKMVETEKGRILKKSSGELNVRRHLCTVHVQIREFDQESLKSECTETHRMRFFFPMELEAFLDCSGFMPLKLATLGDLSREPDETTWNALSIARKAAVSSG